MQNNESLATDINWRDGYIIEVKGKVYKNYKLQLFNFNDSYDFYFESEKAANILDQKKHEEYIALHKDEQIMFNKSDLQNADIILKKYLSTRNF